MITRVQLEDHNPQMVPDRLKKSRLPFPPLFSHDTRAERLCLHVLKTEECHSFSGLEHARCVCLGALQPLNSKFSKCLFGLFGWMFVTV